MSSRSSPTTVVQYYCPLLSNTVHYYPLLSNTVQCCLLLSTTVQYCSLLSTTVQYYPLLSPFLEPSPSFSSPLRNFPFGFLAFWTSRLLSLLLSDFVITLHYIMIHRQFVHFHNLHKTMWCWFQMVFQALYVLQSCTYLFHVFLVLLCLFVFWGKIMIIFVITFIFVLKWSLPLSWGARYSLGPGAHDTIGSISKINLQRPSSLFPLPLVISIKWHH